MATVSVKRSIPKDCPRSERERKFSIACLSPPYVKLGIFTCNEDKEMYKKVRSTCRVVVLLIKPFDFHTLSLPLLSSDLNFPKV